MEKKTKTNYDVPRPIIVPFQAITGWGYKIMLGEVCLWESKPCFPNCYAAIQAGAEKRKELNECNRGD